MWVREHLVEKPFVGYGRTPDVGVAEVKDLGGRVLRQPRQPRFLPVAVSVEFVGQKRFPEASVVGNVLTLGKRVKGV